LRLDAAARQEVGWRVNFPLSTNSVFGEKKVSRENENILKYFDAAARLERRVLAQGLAAEKRGRVLTSA
jgi:hypothetical protein